MLYFTICGFAPFARKVGKAPERSSEPGSRERIRSLGIQENHGRRKDSPLKIAALKLTNTPSICRKYYVHSALIEVYLNVKLFAAWERQASEIQG